METRSYTTQMNFTNPEKEWLLVNAENQTLGRLASKVAYLLRGKHKPAFTPHLDTGAHVIVINAQKIRFTGKKSVRKQYVRHTGYPGGQRTVALKDMLLKKPQFVIEHAVRKMLPTTRLGKTVFKNLHVFADDKHNHEAQQPKPVDLKILLEKNK